MCGETHTDKNKNRLKTYFGAICKKRCNVSTCYEHLNLDKHTGVGEHCLATGHSVSKNNIRVLRREQEWQRRKKSRRPSTSSNRAPRCIVSK